MSDALAGEGNAPVAARDAVGSAAAGAHAPVTRRPVRFRARGFVTGGGGISFWITLAAILAVWQTASSAGWVSEIFLPSPQRILEALWSLVASGELWRHLAPSLYRIGVGWALGTSLGILAGLSMGLFSVARATGLPMVSAIFPIPKIALMPLLILWLGIGETSKIATIMLGAFFPTTLTVYGGVCGVPLNLIRMAQSFEVPFLTIVRKVIIPGSLPAMFSGFRISASVSLLLVVSAEMIGAEAGIGAFVLQAGNLMRTDQLLAGVVVLAVLGFLFGKIITALEAHFLRWR